MFLAAYLFFIFCAEKFSALMLAVNDSVFAAAMAAGDAAFAAFENKSARDAYGRAAAIDSSNYEALWKLARAYIDVGQAAKDAEQKQNYFIGEKIARRCVALHPDSAEGHFFLAVAVGRVALMVGGKKKIALSKEVKVEAEKTLEINPKHDGAMHTLGRWHYELANLSWFLKAAAKIIYGGVPTGASNEQAQKWFEKAIAIAPEMPVHHLWLGETLIELEDYANARKHLEACISLKEVFWDDAKNKTQAAERLKDIKNKK
jgi:tetratricopeptide (TPR) repeat protein